MFKGPLPPSRCQNAARELPCQPWRANVKVEKGSDTLSHDPAAQIGLDYRGEDAQNGGDKWLHVGVLPVRYIQRKCQRVRYCSLAGDTVCG